MPKKKAAVEAIAPISLAGYRRPARFRWFEFTEMPGLEEGQEPLRVKVQCNLTFDEINAIPLKDGTPYEELFVALAPYVIEWNLPRYCHETGEVEIVPAPAVAGPDVFLLLDRMEVNWIGDKVKFGYLAMEQDAVEAMNTMRTFLEEAKKNASGPSATTDGPSSDDDSGSASAKRKRNAPRTRQPA